MISNHAPQYHKHAVEPALRSQDALGQAVHGSGGGRKETVPDARWCVWIGCTTRQQKRAEVGEFYSPSY